MPLFGFGVAVGVIEGAGVAVEVRGGVNELRAGKILSDVPLRHDPRTNILAAGIIFLDPNIAFGRVGDVAEAGEFADFAI